MPAFAFVSGYLYHASVQHHDTIEIIKRKFRSIILPLLAWSLILSIVGTQYRSIDSIMIVVAKNYLSNVGYSLWFLWGVLFCSLLVLVQTRLQKYVPFKLSCFILVLLTLISPRNYNIYLYSFIYPFFIFGFLMSETDIIKELKRLSKKNVLCVTVIFFFIQLAGMLVFEPGDFVYVSGSNVLLPFSLPKMGAFVLRIVFGTTGICFTILFSRLLQIVLESKSRVMEIICRFGQLSLTGYALDTAVIQIIFPQIEGTLSPHLFIWVIETICVLLCLILLSKVLSHSKFLRLFLMGR